jgi:threonine synthase
MKFYSTNNHGHRVSFREAVLESLPPDNGLYLPEVIDPLPASFIENLSDFSFQEIAFKVTRQLIGDSIPDSVLAQILNDALTFPVPLVKVTEGVSILELFHGPSLAFKDFGAAFMSRVMGYLNQGASQDLVVLVATSGDTGGAVASGFFEAPGVQVVILYPSGKVSALQEKQLTTWGGNIHALEVEGTFDDCQQLVKQAFLDDSLGKEYRFTSANSINIARLIPQTFYYFEGYKQLKATQEKVVFCVPSGNFGNLTAGLIAQKLGLPIKYFLAATNNNDVVPQYLASGVFSPRPSTPTLSNAMDVGNPSNFARILDLYGSTWNQIKSDIKGYSCDDTTTLETIRKVYQDYGYILDPHTAVGWAAIEEDMEVGKERLNYVLLSTAHPSKFLPVYEKADHLPYPVVPDRLQEMARKDKQAIRLKPTFTQFKQALSVVLS